MKWNAAGTIALAVVMTACGSRGEETRTIELAHLSPDGAMMLVEPYVPGGAGKLRATERPAALTVTAPAARLDQIEELVKRYDVAAPGVRLHFQVIEADGFTTTDSAIAQVEASLRELFRFRGYRLASEAMLAGRAQSDVAQQISGPDGRLMTIRAAIRGVTAVEGRSSVELEVDLALEGASIMRTGVTVPDGQTVVLGSGRPTSDRPTLILVVRPEIG